MAELAQPTADEFSPLELSSLNFQSHIEQATFEKLLGYEDPDLLLFFLGQAQADDDAVMVLIDKIKRLKHQNHVS